MRARLFSARRDAPQLACSAFAFIVFYYARGSGSKDKVSGAVILSTDSLFFCGYFVGNRLDRYICAAESTAKRMIRVYAVMITLKEKLITEFTRYTIMWLIR